MKSLARWLRGGDRPIATPRLRLVAMTASLLAAEEQGHAALAAALHATAAPDWPPDLWRTPVRAHITSQLTTEPHTAGWHRYMLLCGEPAVIGCIGAFPCAAGDVELGYSVVDSQQRRGFATEAANALIRWLFLQPAVHSVSAQAYESSLASVKVMQHCGMRWVGGGEEPGTVRYRRWRDPA